MPTQSFDEQLHTKLLDAFKGTNKGERLAGNYSKAQSDLQTEVYPNIPAAEPSLSDHGTDHIANVKQNVIDLLSDHGEITNLTGIEMYCLGMLILFHDAGNVYGRKNHHKNVAKVFDKIRGTAPSVRHEKTLIVRAAQAHTGTTQDGSRDTLEAVGEIESFEGKRVRLRELAAILRFADELAEGPQRTSEFMQAEKLYAAESQMFHTYASCADIFIDRRASRIALTYEIDIGAKSAGKYPKKYFSKFFEFVYKRLLKLNQERQYARHYSDLLTPFKSTDVRFNFHCRGEILDTNLAPLKLADFVVPDETIAKDLVAIDADYDIDPLVTDLLSKCPRK